jgi:hypothetical protein
MNNIIDQTTMTSDAIIGNTLEVASGKLKVRAQGITSNEMAAGSVTSNAIVDGTIVNADINASAAIAGTKISPNFGSQNISTTGTVSTGAGSVISGSSSNAALRVTQTGSGPALLIEDSTNPDSTPLTVDANGDLIIGHTSSILNGSLEVVGTNIATTRTQLMRYSNDDDACGLFLNKSRSSTIGTPTVVQNGDLLGYIHFRGDDSTLFHTGVSIEAQVDGTPGLNDMPGRMVIATTPDGSASPIERLRIDRNGNVGIGQTNPQNKLDILDSAGTANFALRVKTDGVANDSGIWSNSNNDISFDARNRFTDLTVSIKSFGDSFLTGGNLGLGTPSPSSILHTRGVANVAKFESSTNDANIQIITNEGANNRVEVTNRPGGRMALWNNTSGDVLNIVQNGNVGIGTTIPSSKLDILDSAGTSGFAIRVKTDGVANDSGIWTDSSNNVYFDARNGAGSLNASIRSSGNSFLTGGNLGIGTSSPSSILHTYANQEVAKFESSTNQAYVKIQTSEGDSNRVEIANRTGGRMALYNPTSGDVVNILQNGNVGIGKDNPSTRLDVNGTVTATAFSGNITGNVTGNVTGSASTVSNGAITAEKLNGAQSGDAPIYGCRAWVSFAGRSTNGDCTIRSAGNVYRVARTAEGRYTVYFTTAMQDADYATITGSDANSAHKIAGVISQAAGEVEIAYSQIQTSTSRIDPTWGQVSIFR